MTVGRLHTLGKEAADDGINLSVMMNAVTFQMTWPGAPAVYYGDEAGLSGWTDPDNRRTYPWGNENNTLLEYHKFVIDLRRRCGALKNGSIKFLYLDHGILSYGRWDGDNIFLIIINNTAQEKNISAPAWKIGTVNGKMRLIVSTFNDGFNTDGRDYAITDGKINIMAPPRSSAIFIYES